MNEGEKKEMSFNEKMECAEKLASQFAGLEKDEQRMIGEYISGFLAGMEAQKAKQAAV